VLLALCRSKLPPSETEISSMAQHLLLREATQEVDERLHRRDGFAAIQNFTRDIAEYRGVPVRFYGFYVPLEPAAAVGRDRSVWLEDDLSALRMDKRTIAAAPRCSDRPCLNSAECQLGALCVTEGSALGDPDLWRGPEGLLSRDVTQGRRCFLGRGTGAGEARRGYLAHLSTASGEVPAAITKGRN